MLIHLVEARRCEWIDITYKFELTEDGFSKKFIFFVVQIEILIVKLDKIPSQPII